MVEPDYTMDIAVLRGSGRGLVIHSSGVHGVEGYAGSAIQIAVAGDGRTQQPLCRIVQAPSSCLGHDATPLPPSQFPCMPAFT